jgi:TRAP-type C4-dicarboxylate transport system substrate-binding protein
LASLHQTQSSPAKIAGLKIRTHDTMTALTYFAVVGIVMLILFMTKDPMEGK